jgi:hypothetical protein
MRIRSRQLGYPNRLYSGDRRAGRGHQDQLGLSFRRWPDNNMDTKYPTWYEVER